MTMAVDPRTIDQALELGRLLDGSPWRQLWLSERHSIWCLVDADDWEWIGQWRWNWAWHRNSQYSRYAKRNVGTARSTVYLHRELMIHYEPDFNRALVVDHINGQSLDNRRANLRGLTSAQNSACRVPWDRIPSIERVARQLLKNHQPAEAPPF